MMAKLVQMKDVANVWLDHQLVEVQDILTTKERGIIQEVLANAFGKPLEVTEAFFLTGVVRL